MRRIILRIFLIVCALIILLGLFSVFCNFFVNMRGQAMVVSSDSTQPQSLPRVDYAIVPGAAVWGSEPSPVLQERLDFAAILYQHDLVVKLYLSGAPNEVQMMQQYLDTKQIPRSAEQCDPDGLDTTLTVAHARATFGPQLKGYLITEPAHAGRAGYLLRGYGLVNCRVAACDLQHLVERPVNAVHEYFAASKAFLQFGFE
ncbi:MAG: YdcF family protein [Coriobacteriales bacterium]|nr:YdcF family protein [Coriobacteriales bacterium]